MNISEANAVVALIRALGRPEEQDGLTYKSVRFLAERAGRALSMSFADEADAAVERLRVGGGQ